MGAVVAVAGMMKKQKDLVARFREARAISAATAQSLAALRIDEGLAFRRLRAHTVIREPAPGTFYLDEPSWLALGHVRRRLATVILLVVFAMALTIALISVSL